MIIKRFFYTLKQAFLQVFSPEELLVHSVAEQLLADVVEVRHPSV